MNKRFASVSVGVIFFHNDNIWEKMLIDPQEILCNLVQQIQLEDKIAVATPVLIQEIYVP